MTLHTKSPRYSFTTSVDLPDYDEAVSATVHYERRDCGVMMRANEDVRAVVVVMETEMVESRENELIRFADLPEIARERISAEAQTYFGRQGELLRETFSTS